MVFRLAKENDFDMVHELMSQIFEIHLQRRPDVFKQGDPYTFEHYMESINNEDQMMIVAENDEMVVGVCHMVKRYRGKAQIVRERYLAFIEDFCVHKDYQRQGLGRALYEEAVKRAKTWNADSIELNVWKINEEARKFYDSIGLKPKSTIMEIKLN